MIRSLVRGLVAAGLAVAAVNVAGFVTGGDDRTVQAVGGTIGAGGEYHALTPQRILDTRDTKLDVQPAGRKPISPTESGATFDVPIVGKGGLPEFVDNDKNGEDDNVLAVAVNITVVTPTHEGWLRAWGKGASEGSSSVVNFKPGQVVPNNAILRPGKDGKLTIRLVGTGAGSADVLIDVFGWWSSSNHDERGARLIPVSPTRVYDSREAKYRGSTVKGGETIKVPVSGVAGVSKDDVVGVMVNLTGVNIYGGSRATHFSILPTQPTGAPTTSNLNLWPGDVRANASIVPVQDGSIYIHNFAGESDIIVDVVAYLQPKLDDTHAGRVVPLVSPFRAFDTREKSHGEMPLGPGRAEDWSFEEFAADVKIGSQHVGPQLGLLGNLTATGLTRPYDWGPAIATHLTAFPTPADPKDTKVPTVSNLNLGEGFNVPNLALLKYGDVADPQVRFHNYDGHLHYLLDVSAVILADG